MRILISCLICLLIISCKKSSSGSGGDIVGRWKLQQSLADPGNGLGKWETVVPSTIVVFSSGGKFSGGNYFFSGFNRYSVENDSVMVFGSTVTNSSIKVRYTLSSYSLDIYPPCIEACGFKLAYTGK